MAVTNQTGVKQSRGNDSVGAPQTSDSVARDEPSEREHAEARAVAEIEARKAKDAIDQARRKLDADQAEAQRVATIVLPVDATDAQIDELAVSTARAGIRVNLSTRALAEAEEAAKPILEQAAKASRAAQRRRLLESQARVAERFRSEFPEAVDKLFRLFIEAHAIEMAAENLPNDRTEGEEGFVSAFRFSNALPPVSLRVQVIGGDGKPMWEGDQNSDVASQWF